MEFAGWGLEFGFRAGLDWLLGLEVEDSVVRVHVASILRPHALQNASQISCIYRKTGKQQTILLRKNPRTLSGTQGILGAPFHG